MFAVCFSLLFPFPSSIVFVSLLAAGAMRTAHNIAINLFICMLLERENAFGVSKRNVPDSNGSLMSEASERSKNGDPTEQRLRKLFILSFCRLLMRNEIGD